MNDTFDNFTFSEITSSNHPKNLPNSSKTEEVFFDDSLFLNSQEFVTLRSQIQENANYTVDFLDQSSFEVSKSINLSKSGHQKINESTSSVNEIFSNSKTEINQSTINESTSSVNDIFGTPSFSLNEPKSPQIETQPKLDEDHIHKLSSWGLPASILQKYESRKITKMFPWQVECLQKSKVLKNHENLVYSAPTSAGKTLVAEILAIKTVLERKKKVIFILPFVSVVREKMFYFQEIFSGSGVRVEGFMGSYNPPGGFQNVQFAICTIEKANSLINHFLQDGTLSEIGAVIIDEMHLIGEPNRGYILELLLTKLKYITLKDKKVDIQIIGMSATLPNLETLSKWLNSELYVTNFRPIPLYEQALVSSVLYDTNFQKIRKIQNIPDLETDTDHILQLCLETINSNCSVLIFCPTKNWCENLAQQISTAFWKIGTSKTELSLKLREQLKTDPISELLEQLKCCPVGLDNILRKTVSFGVAFHHAGLTLDERDIIEGAFRNGVVRVLVATLTLSSGVNLPAKRVIIRSPMAHGKPLDSLTYRQMIGRAGRMGKDTSGESILVCQKSEEKFARLLMCEQLPPIESCLEESKLKRAILEVVASGVASTPEDVHLFTNCTLLAQKENFDDPIEESLKFLVKNEFLRLKDTDNGKKYIATGLGKACLSSSIPPEDGLALFTELEKARQCFVLETELHLIYLVTPYSACYQWGNIDWMFYLSLWEKLPSSMRKVGELVGVRESYLICATRGKLQTNTSKLYHQLLVHKRFFVALALQDLVNEKPLSEVCEKFHCNRGMLQTLQLTASTFAGMVTSFSKQLGWSTVEILISQFQDRLHFGVNRELLDLMKLPILNGRSARALFNGGLETLVQIANSDVDTIEGILHKVIIPFESGKMRDGESEFALKERNKLKNIWITGKEGLTEREAAELLLVNARDYLRIEMGLKEAKWEEHIQKISNSNESFLESTPLRTLNMSLNSSGDFITTSQDESVSFKTPITTRKRSRRGKENGLVGESPRKKIRMKESLSFDKIEIVDVCSNEQLFSAFCTEANLQKIFTLAVACTKTEEQKRTIGLTPMDKLQTKFSHKNRRVVGFSVAWGKNISYFINLDKMEKSLDFMKLLLNREVTVIMFNAKKQIKVLKNCCDINLGSNIEDPAIGDWILEPEGREKNFQAMINIYCSNLSKVAQMAGFSKHQGPSLDINSTVEVKIRASVEALLSWHLNEAIKEELNTIPQFSKIYATEMSCLRILAKMELTGVPTDHKMLSTLSNTLNKQLKIIERKAFSLSGRRFSFSSTREVAKILGLHQGRKVSTKKEILEKNENPISDLVLKWRKIYCTITKVVEPLLRSVENGRIHGCCITHTSTGRITMHEPNLQNVTKNFEFDNFKISCRDAFIAEKGKVLVSADYCQLELRLLAHLSQDGVLCESMRSGADVFRSVAAKCNKIKEEEVNDELRQRAKQICYGIIYGMGTKSLAEQLNIDELQATVFMDTFKNTYPEVKKYILETIEKCRNVGFVETIAGRRRYLQHINHRNPVVKGQAERQAVNTTIQGSAADLVKQTMISLEEKLISVRNCNLVLHLHDELIYEVSEDTLGVFLPILKSTMEGNVGLSIPFPVKVKVGKSWGQLTEYKL